MDKPKPVKVEQRQADGTWKSVTPAETQAALLELHRALLRKSGN